jgi:hypothetical protein
LRHLPRCDRTEQCPDKTLDTVHTNLLSSFCPSNQGRSVTSGKIDFANLPVLFCLHALMIAGLNRSKIMVYRRWSLPMPPVVPAHRPVHFPPVLREMESTSTSLQLRSGPGSSTIVYILTPEDESDVKFS